MVLQESQPILSLHVRQVDQVITLLDALAGQRSWPRVRTPHPLRLTGGDVRPRLPHANTECPSSPLKFVTTAVGDSVRSKACRHGGKTAAPQGRVARAPRGNCVGLQVDPGSRHRPSAGRQPDRCAGRRPYGPSGLRHATVASDPSTIRDCSEGSISLKLAGIFYNEQPKSLILFISTQDS